MAEKKKEITGGYKSDEDAIEALWDKYGPQTLMRMSDAPTIKVPVISTGNVEIDMALGLQGLARGRIAEIYGPEMSGKTTLALEIIAQAQQEGDMCAFVDAEHALDFSYAQAIGVKADRFFLSQPDTGEQALTIVDDLCKSGRFGVVVVDSVAALTPRAELEGEIGDANVGLQARMMSQALKKISASAEKGNTLVIFINQLREKIGVMFGSPETTPGGRALRYYASYRIDIRKRDAIKEKGEDDPSGNLTKIKIVKNKLAPPLREATVSLMYGEGISREYSLLTVGEELGVLGKSGAWFVAPSGEKIANGREASRQALVADPTLADEIEGAIRAKLWPPDDV